MTTTATANHRPVPTVVLEGIPSVTGGAVNNSSSNNNNNNASSDDDSAGAAGGDVLMALPPRFSSSAASVATTQLASDVGSVMGKPKIAKLKSVTWYRNIDTATPLLQLTMQDTKIRRKNKVALATVRAAPPPCVGQNEGSEDSLTSMIVPGHVVKCIHNQPCKGLSAEACTEMWNNPPPPQEDGSASKFASITVADPHGDEVWVKATIYKPRPDMTLDDLGMTVWYWGYVSKMQLPLLLLFLKRMNLISRLFLLLYTYTALHQSH